MNSLFFGDNLHVLRQYVGDRTVDLIYLDPPFNSKSRFNILYKTPVGAREDARVDTFKDTWHWEEDAAADALDEVRKADIGVFDVLRAFESHLEHSDMMAYLAMMAVRLLELRRVLKKTGSLYLHCDSTAGHYLKILLDTVFGPKNFRSDIIWKRQSAHSDANTKFATVTDNVLFYARSAEAPFNVVRTELDPEYVKKFYRHRDPDGRLFRLDNMSAPEGGGMSATNKKTGKPNGWYEWKGYEPPTRGWRYSPETMAKLDAEGRLHYPKEKTGRIALKRYLDENKGQAVSNLWTDIPPVQGAESIGYATQKPRALVERIIAASSQPGDVVLDPFCGCGTAIHAAEKMGRQWIGIDVTYLAIQIIEDRIKSWLPNAKYTVLGIPKDEFAARKLAQRDPYTFQQWAVSRVGGQSRGKGADRGIDGEIVFLWGPRKYGRAIVSVKGGKNVNPDMVRALMQVVKRERADMGVFISLEKPTPAMRNEAASADRIELPGGTRSRLQFVTVADLINGPNLGVLTQMNAVQAAEAARKESRKRRKTLTPEELHREPPLPPMGIGGGKVSRTQKDLAFDEPLLVPQVQERKRKRA